MKRFIAMFCVFALMLSLSVAALAEEPSPVIVLEAVVAVENVPEQVIVDPKTVDPVIFQTVVYDSILPAPSEAEREVMTIKESGAYKFTITTLKDRSLKDLILVFTADDGTVTYFTMEQFAFGFNPETGEITLYFHTAGTFDILAPVLG